MPLGVVGLASCFLETQGVGLTPTVGATGGNGGAAPSMSSASASNTVTSGASSSSVGATGGAEAGPDAPEGCGDGVVEPGEQCDGTNLDSQTCASLGHTGGVLACSPSCMFDQSQCFDYPTNWYDIAWHHRRAITIHASQVTADITNLPVVVSVTDPSLLGKLQSGAQDVLLTAGDGKTKLSHEIEVFDATSNSLVVWVRVPSLSSSSDTSLYLYYGNATCPDQQDPANVWDVYDQGVWHLAEKAVAGGTTTIHHDSTGHSHDGAQNGNSDTQGKLGRAQAFDGVSNYIEVGNPSGIQIGTANCTISMWLKTSTNRSTGMGVFSKTAAGVNGQFDKVLGVTSSSKVDFSSYNVGTLSSATVVDDGNWHHVAWVQSMGTPATWTFYVDGMVDTSTQLAPVSDVAAYNVRIASVVTGTVDAGTFFSGIIDEVRVAATARSNAWIVTSYRNQAAPASFYALGAEEGQLP